MQFWPYVAASINTSASYSEGFGLKSQFRDRLFWLGLLVLFFIPSSKVLGYYSKLSCDHFHIISISLVILSSDAV